MVEIVKKHGTQQMQEPEGAQAEEKTQQVIRRDTYMEMRNELPHSGADRAMPVEAAVPVGALVEQLAPT